MSVDPIEFGRVIGHLEAIQRELKDLKERTVWRLDNLEGRVEKLEKADLGQSVYIKIVEKGMWGVLGAVGYLGLKALGVV